MGTTTKYALRYPELADPPNVQQDIKNLATDVDNIPAPAPPVGTLIAYTQLTSSGISINLGTASAVIPVTGLAVTFIAPPSGNVLVKCSILGQTRYNNANGDGIISCSMYSAGVAIGYTEQLLHQSGSTGTVISPQVRLNFSQVYTGLTPGNSYTFTPNFQSWNANQGTLWYGAGGAGTGSNPPFGPAVIEVYSAS